MLDIVVGWDGPLLKNHLIWAIVLLHREHCLRVSVGGRSGPEGGSRTDRRTGTGGQRPKLGGCGRDWKNEATTRLIQMNLENTDRIYRLLLSAIWVVFVFCLSFHACCTSHTCMLALSTLSPWRSCTSTAHSLYPSTI
jgi:hypothetical protein